MTLRSIEILSHDQMDLQEGAPIEEANNVIIPHGERARSPFNQGLNTKVGSVINTAISSLVEIDETSVAEVYGIRDPGLYRLIDPVNQGNPAKGDGGVILSGDPSDLEGIDEVSITESYPFMVNDSYRILEDPVSANPETTVTIEVVDLDDEVCP